MEYGMLIRALNDNFRSIDKNFMDAARDVVKLQKSVKKLRSLVAVLAGFCVTNLYANLKLSEKVEKLASEKEEKNC